MERVTPDLSANAIQAKGATEKIAQGVETFDSGVSTLGAGANLLNLLKNVPSAAKVTGAAAKFEPLMALLQGIDLARIIGDSSYRDASIESVNDMAQTPDAAPAWLGGGLMPVPSEVTNNFNPSAAFHAMGRAPATIYGLSGHLGQTVAKNAMTSAQEETYAQENFSKNLARLLKNQDVPPVNIRGYKPGLQQAANKQFFK